MKNRIAFLYLFLIGSSVIVAQTKLDSTIASINNNTFYEGYIVDIHNDTLFGFIRFSNFVDFQHEVQFYKDRNDRSTRTIYRPADVTYIDFSGLVYHCIPYSGGRSSSAIKANLLLEENCIEQYLWFEKAAGADELIKRPTESEEEFFKKKYDITFVYFNTRQRKAVDIDYFLMDANKRVRLFLKEYFEQVSEYDDVEIFEDEIVEIFEQYNTWCNRSDSAN